MTKSHVIFFVLYIENEHELINSVFNVLKKYKFRNKKTFLQFKIQRACNVQFHVFVGEER